MTRKTEKRCENSAAAGERLAGRILKTVVPTLAQGFLEDRKHRLGLARQPTDDELRDIYDATLTLLYRLLFLLYAEGRGLLIGDPDESGNPQHRIARLLAENRVSDRCLAAAIDCLIRNCDATTSSSAFVDYKSLEVRHLGSIYERLLEFKLNVANDGLTLDLSNDKAERRAGGSYYTPEGIVKYIVEQTVGPVLSEHLEKLQGDALEQLFDFRVLDPAMGSGHFLVEAADCITERLLRFSKDVAGSSIDRLIERTRKSILASLRKQSVTIDPDKLSDANLLKRHVLTRCIYGVDLNPMAVELAKMSLWLDASAVGEPLTFLDGDLRCGDSLAGPTIEGFAGFDAVVSNPPYSGHRGDFDAAPLKRLYAVCRNNPNPAVAFLDRGFTLLREHGRLGMIVPKSIQYVQSWESSRRLLSESNNLIGIADVSQAFDGVLLEQTICLAAKQPAVDGYEAHTLGVDGTFSVRRIDREIADCLGCLPAHVDDRSLELLRRILQVGPRLSDIGTTSQALGYQAHLNKDVTGKHFPIHRGKQIRPMRINAPTDLIDRSFLTKSGSDDLTVKVSEMLRPKVVSQNIVAHVTRPKPRVWVISAPDRDGILCLNTISTTILHDDRYPIEFIAAILNSTLASWFYTEFVFCRAIRTMHFDNYYAGKLPIAEISPTQHRSFEVLAREMADCDSRSVRQQAIDDAVFEAYGLAADDRRFLRDFCYGTSQVRHIVPEDGIMPQLSTPND